MGEMRYNRVGKRTKCHVSSTRSGFRVSLKRLSVQRLRSRFMFLLNIFGKLRSSYGRAMKKGFSGGDVGLRRNSSRKGLVGDVTPVGRSNSFYAEAIADCLEFIKSSSVSSSEHVV